MTTPDAVYERKPGIAWREEEEARREVLEALEEGRQAEEEGTLIIVDSGQIFELNLLGAEIWKLCDGSRRVDDVVTELLSSYDVEREELEKDVTAFMDDMEQRGWLVIK